MPDDPDDRGVLDPNELDAEDSDRVRSLDDGRYVVEPGDDAGASSQTDPAAGTLPDGTHALTARARAESTTDTLAHDGDDVVVAFEALVRWYAGLVAPDEPAAVATATLLRHSSLAVDGSVESEE